MIARRVPGSRSDVLRLDVHRRVEPHLSRLLRRPEEPSARRTAGPSTRCAASSRRSRGCSARATRGTSRWRATPTGDRTGASQLIPSYKAQRVAEPIPPGLIPQMPVIDAFLAAIGIDAGGCARLRGRGRDRHLDGKGRRDGRDRQRRSRPLRADRGPAGRGALPGEGRRGTSSTRRRSRAGTAIPGRRYADFAMLRGDPSDGLPGLKGVGAVAAASMIREHGSVEALIAAGRLSDANRDYLTRALRVVPPVPDLPIDAPAGAARALPGRPGSAQHPHGAQRSAGCRVPPRRRAEPASASR